MSEKGHKIINIILALVVSVSAWTFVVYNNDPMTDVKYKDIPITFTGESTLVNRGLGISEVSAEEIDVTLNQRRISTNDISAENIIVTADVSEAIEGENGISLQISTPESTSVLEAELKTVTVEVESADSKEFDIAVNYEPGTETNTEPIITAMTSTKATVIGAESAISKVDSINAIVSINAMSDVDRNFTGILRARDKAGKEIPHVVIYPNEVNFNARIGNVKTVSLKVNPVDNKDDYYKREISAPDTITIKGSAADLAGVSSIETEEIYIGQYYEDTEVELEYILPEGIYLADGSGGETMKITVTEQEVDKTDDNN